MAELFTNNASTLISGSLGASGTTVTVSTGTGSKFPSPTGADFFRLVMINKSTGGLEIAQVVSRTGDVLDFNIVGNRGIEGTTALAFNDGDILELRPTAAFFASLTLTTSAVQTDDYNYNAATGTNAYVVTLSPAPASYGSGGLRVAFHPGNANTGNSTLNVNGLGAQSIKLPNGNQVAAGDIVAAQVAVVIYDGTNFILQNPLTTAASSISPPLHTKGTDISNGGTLAIPTDGNSFDVTGTNATVTALSGGVVGEVINLRFLVTATLTHHATDLILPAGGSNISVAVGDEVSLLQYATNDWRVINYERADGGTVVPQIQYIGV